ncbi:MAG TPA: LCP family protein [Ktedonobacteraceae bacterium]
MNNQFKNPLPKKEPQVTPQSDAWSTESVQPAAPGDQSQGNQSPSASQSSRLGGGLFVPQWKAAERPPQAPAPAIMAEQQTVKYPSTPASPTAYAQGSLPRTPEAYVQGQQGRYGPGAGIQQMSPSFQNGQQRPAGFPGNLPPGMGNGPQRPATFPGNAPGMGNGPQAFAPRQQPGTPPMPGPGALGGPAPLPQQNYNSFNRFNASTSFAPGAPPAPIAPLAGTFERKRFGDEPPAKDPRGGKRKKKRRIPIWARVVISFLIILIVLAGGGLAYYQLYFAKSINSIVGQTVPRTKSEGEVNSGLTQGILTGPRVNILLLGSDTDQKFQGNYIAQTDIVVTIDPASNSVGMLSIPRDFYINVPGYGMHKLDEAYGLGGVALSLQTIEQDFGIPINYYAWVGLDGFIKVINEVGGVDVDVLHPIVDDNYPDDVGKNANDPYALKRLYLSPGPQHLDGPTALEYVRSRHADLVGDFGRSVRQQQVLAALKTRLTNPDIFNKLSAIAGDLQGYLKTDMQLTDVLNLMNFARSLDPNKISKLTLGPPYSTTGTVATGAEAGTSVVFPNCTAIIPAIQNMLQLGSKAACNITANSGSSPGGLPLAYTTGKASTLASSSSASISSMAGLLNNSVSNVSGNPAGLFGIQGLVDLLLMGTFESTSVF